MDDGVRPKKPLSSASEIMSRHDKKKRRWFRNLIHNRDTKVSEHSRKGKRKRGVEPSSSITSSLEHAGQLSLSAIGIPERVEKASVKDDDEYSSSVSSNESDQAESLSDTVLMRNRRQNIVRQNSTLSSDSESSLDFELNPVWQDFSNRGQSSYTTPSSRQKLAHPPQKELSGFSSLLHSYIPSLSWVATPRGSFDSVASETEESKALIHLVNNSESDQVRNREHRNELYFSVSVLS